MARHSSLPVRTFSVGFAEGAYSELQHARTIARWLVQADNPVLYDAVIPGAGGIANARSVARLFAMLAGKGTPADTTVACTKTPAKAPFAPTGWKTVAVDHFEMQAVDYKKEAGYYDALMNWKVRADDGKSAALDIGDVATVVIHGGYTPLNNTTVAKSIASPVLALPAFIGPPLTKIDGMLTRAAPIIMPGTILSQLGMQTTPSKQWARSIVSTQSAISSREASEYFMPT